MPLISVLFPYYAVTKDNLQCSLHSYSEFHLPAWSWLEEKGVGRGWEGVGKGLGGGLGAASLKINNKKKAVFAICALVNPRYSLNLFLLNPRWETLLFRSEAAFSELPNIFWSFLWIRLFCHPGVILHGFSWAGWKICSGWHYRHSLLCNAGSSLCFLTQHLPFPSPELWINCWMFLK